MSWLPRCFRWPSACAKLEVVWTMSIRLSSMARIRRAPAQHAWRRSYGDLEHVHNSVIDQLSY